MWFLWLVYIYAWLMALGGSPSGWAFVIVGTGIIIYIWYIENAFKNYDKEIDQSKMAQDIGKDKFEIRRNMVNGKYDKE